MSESDSRESATAAPPAPPHPALTALMIVGGIVLLLPGLCSLFFIVALFGESFNDIFSDPGLVGLWIVCLLISAGGVLLIRQAVRRRKVLPPAGSA
jgi:TRAP-type mannitol/chloroaromatic compound transport system permease small subunit